MKGAKEIVYVINLTYNIAASRRPYITIFKLGDFQNSLICFPSKKSAVEDLDTEHSEDSNDGTIGA